MLLTLLYKAHNGHTQQNYPTQTVRITEAETPCDGCLQQRVPVVICQCPFFNLSDVICDSSFCIHLLNIKTLPCHYT